MKTKKKAVSANKFQFSSFCKKNQIYIAAFLIPFITMLALFAVDSIYPFGDRSFLNIDSIVGSGKSVIDPYCQ